MVAFLKKLRPAEAGQDSTEEQMQIAQNLWSPAKGIHEGVIEEP